MALTIGALATIAVSAPAVAGTREKPNIRFFSGQNSDAHWTPLDSQDPNRMSIELEVGPTVFTDFAGLVLNHVEGQPAPVREPYFYHKEDRAGPSGGSPRLVIIFPNGNMQLRPDQWSTSWQLVGEGDGDGNWDVSGGTCGFLFDATYAQARACFPNGIVSAVILVTDSNFLYPGYTNWVDRLQYNSFEFSHARDNNNSSV